MISTHPYYNLYGILQTKQWITKREQIRLTNVVRTNDFCNSYFLNINYIFYTQSLNITCYNKILFCKVYYI